MFAEVNLVCVHGEDLFFRQTQFEKDSNECFRNLSPQRWLSREEKASCQLLRYRASALQSTIFMKIPDECADDSFEIDAMMNEKLLIFSCYHRIEKDLRQVIEFHHTAFRAP